MSDNSTDAEACATLRAGCAELGRGQVQYIQPSTSLTMTDHWEWALGRALECPSVGAVGFLTDRMLFARGELGRVLAALAITPHLALSYNLEYIDDFDNPVRLLPNEWSGRLLRIPSRSLIHAAARGEAPMSLPRMLNSVVPRSVLDAIRARFGSVFASVAPDFAFAFRLLVTVESIGYLDRPVLINRANWRSNGMSVLRGIPSSENVDFARLTGSAMYANTPAPQLQTISNAIFNEYCFVRNEAPDTFPPLSRLSYLAAIARDLRRMENEALVAETSEQLRELGWTRVLGYQARNRKLASFARFYTRRPHVAARRIFERVARRTLSAPRTAPSVEAAIADLENRPVPKCDDGARLRPLLDAGAPIEVLARL